MGGKVVKIKGLG